MHHVGDIQAPCRHRCSYQNRHSPRFEIFQSLDIVDIIETKFKWDGMIRHNRTLLHHNRTILHQVMTNSPAPSRFEADRHEYWWLGTPVENSHKLKHDL